MSEPTHTGLSASVRRILAVAGLTFREAYRRKVFLAALAMSGAFLLLFGLGLHFAGSQILPQAGAAEELARRAVATQLLNFGLMPASFIVGLTAVFASVGTVSGELDTGVAYGVLSRPVTRAEVVIGKFLGLGTMLAAYDILLVASLSGLAAWQVGTPLRNLPGALLFFALEPLLLVALAILGSVRLPTLANGVLCTAAYGVAWVGGDIEQIGGYIKSVTMQNIGIVTSLLLPVDAMHRKAMALLVPQGLLGLDAAGAMGIGTPELPSMWMTFYAVAYVIGAVWLAGRTFSRRDL
ncbi:MAG: ABC transporter permease [Coriobacteriia bacterium]|nr:ABC transporter permease [Coriobacteriia bacterium]